MVAAPRWPPLPRPPSCVSAGYRPPRKQLHHAHAPALRPAFPGSAQYWDRPRGGGSVQPRPAGRLVGASIQSSELLAVGTGRPACLVTHRLSEHTQPLNLQLVQRPGKLCSRAPSASTAATSGPRRGLSGCHHHGDQAVTPEHGGRGASAHPGLPLHKHVESTRWERRGYRDLKPRILQRGGGALCQARHTAVNPGLLSSFLALGAHWPHNYLKKCLRTKEDTLVAKG